MATKKAAAKPKRTAKKTASGGKRATTKVAKKVSKKPAVKKVTAKKPVVKKKSAVKKPTAKKPAAKKKAVSRKSVAKKKPVAKKTAIKKKAAVKKVVVKKKPAAKKKAAVKVATPIPASPAKRAAKRREKKLSASQAKKFRTMLIKTREELTRQVAFLRRSSLTRADSVYSEEDGTDAFERQLALKLAGTDGDSIFEIDQALHRLDEGVYGVCEDCDDLIEAPRLKALPFARRCVKCKSVAERNGTVRGNRTFSA